MMIIVYDKSFVLLKLFHSINHKKGLKFSQKDDAFLCILKKRSIMKKEMKVNDCDSFEREKKKYRTHYIISSSCDNNLYLTH